jgi:chromosome segregation ATPase
MIFKTIAMMRADDKLDLILEILKQHSKQFEQIDKRFEQIDKRFEQIDKRLDRMEHNQNEEKRRLDEVYNAREKVKITFGWQWGMVSLFIAIIASGITKIFG